MSILNIENKRLEILRQINSGCSVNLSAYLSAKLIALLQGAGDAKLIESYLPEVYPIFKNSIKNYEVFATNPEITSEIFRTGKDLYSKMKDDELLGYLKIIEEKLEQLNNHLEGKNIEENEQDGPGFPLIEEKLSGTEVHRFAYLEKISVTIHKSSENTAFVIVPSEKEIESRIKTQVETSWNLACKYVMKYIRKIHPEHKVIVSFEKRFGWYSGDSLGVLLTLKFIEELLKFYNAPFYLLVKKNVAFTGGIKEDGRITTVSEEYIKEKAAAVFFSGAAFFAVPEKDKAAADSALDKLRLKYPDRKLSIVATEDLTDLINRRNLVELNKRSYLHRGVKAAKQNYLSLIMMVLLFVVVFISGLWDFDRNPAILKYESQYLKVYNKNNKLLWSEKAVYSFSTEPGNEISRRTGFVYDINNDGYNEIILSNYYFGFTEDNVEESAVLCYDKDKQLIWQYNFKQKVSSSKINFENDYRLTFFPVDNIDSAGTIPVIARNHFYPSAIFLLNIYTGERIGDIFWHAGHIESGVIVRDEESDTEKIFAGGINNGFEAAAVMILDKNKLSGQAVTSGSHLLKDIPLAKPDKYILIPQTDYSEYKGDRYNRVSSAYVNYRKENDLFVVAVIEDISTESSGVAIYYFFNRDLSINFIETGDRFQHHRDKLVSEGKLQPPLTYTKEYFEILKNNIRYWDGEKFVRGGANN